MVTCAPAMTTDGSLQVTPDSSHVDGSSSRTV